MDNSDYNHFEMPNNNFSNSALNQTEKVKLSDYLRIVDSKSGEGTVENQKTRGNKVKNVKINNKEQINYEEVGQYGANITFESLSAIAKIFSADFHVNEESEIDFDDDNKQDSNIEEVTEDDHSELFDKRKSQPEFISKYLLIKSI